MLKSLASELQTFLAAVLALVAVATVVYLSKFKHCSNSLHGQATKWWVSIIMVALWNRTDHYIFILWFLLLFFLA